MANLVNFDPIFINSIEKIDAKNNLFRFSILGYDRNGYTGLISNKDKLILNGEYIIDEWGADGTGNEPYIYVGDIEGVKNESERISIYEAKQTNIWADVWKNVSDKLTNYPLYQGSSEVSVLQNGTQICYETFTVGDGEYVDKYLQFDKAFPTAMSGKMEKYFFGTFIA